MEQEPSDLNYEALQQQRNKLRDDVSRLEATLRKWQDGEFDKPRHVLFIKESLTTEQYNRLKDQCERNFGIGKFILLEGGVEYRGMTEQPRDNA